MHHRIRLYQSALNDVTYVYGKPVRFNSSLIRERSKDYVTKVNVARK